MKLAFIGGGNMASALIGGLRRRGGTAYEILVVERDAARRAAIEGEHAVAAQEASDARIEGAGIVVLAVKPGDMRTACEALAPYCGSSLVLSIAAGIPSDAVARWCATEAVVRAMPNTPALIGQGITGLYARPGVTSEQREEAGRILNGVGEVVWFGDEALLDAVTAISGSGPAYVFRFIEALQQAAQGMGIEPALARRLAVHTFAGAAQLALQSGEDPAVLRERVTSKGGTTAAALASMEAAGVGRAIVAAAFAALERSKEMGRTMGE